MRPRDVVDGLDAFAYALAHSLLPERFWRPLRRMEERRLVRAAASVRECAQHFRDRLEELQAAEANRKRWGQ